MLSFVSRTPFSYSSADFGQSPFLVFWELTRACDLVCQHCRACAQPKRHPNELNTDQALRLIDALTRFPKPPMLILTGGDPLKRDDLPQIVKYAVDRKLHVALTPSATPLLTLDAVAELKEMGLAGLAMSLDGATAEHHDRFRGVEGSYARTLSIIEGAAAMGLHVQVNTTLTRSNFEQIETMAETLRPLGLGTWSVFFLVPVGRGLATERMSPAAYEMAFAKLLKLAGEMPYRIKTTEAPHYRRFVAQHAPQMAARAVLTVPTNDGRGVMFISHTGDIYPTGFLPKKCGKFPDDCPVDVYQNSPVFLALRDPTQLKGKCGACNFKTVCGGSRARAYAVTRDYLAAEPDCAYIPPGWTGGGQRENRLAILS